MARGEENQNPHPVDRHVGRRVQEKRLDLGLSQTALGKAVGVSFQQMQKYEKGQNRISASKLFEIADFLKVDIPFFFDGYGGRPGGRGGARVRPRPCRHPPVARDRAAGAPTAAAKAEADPGNDEGDAGGRGGRLSCGGLSMDAARPAV